MFDAPMKSRPRTSQPAFTLVELLTVVTIVAILTAILLPVLGAARKQADSVQCVSQLRQIGAGIAAYANDHDGSMPGPLTMKQSADDDGGAGGSLASLLANYLGASGTASAAVAASGHGRRQTLFLCPAAARQFGDRKTPTYIMNMLPVPGFNQSAWGDASLREEPLRQAALTNWSDAQIEGRPLNLAEIWAIKDADQEYFHEIGARLDSVKDLPPTPAHGDHRNALFHDFHVARVNLMRVVIKITPEP
jgi:prepilin-type N-terminal cleavage/methylation domain-containing protein